MDVDVVGGKTKKHSELLPEHYRDPEQLYQEGQELIAKKKLNEAERIFNFLLGIDRDNVYCLFYLGTIQMHRDNLALGRQILLRCLDLKPDFAEAHNNLGFISDRDNRKQEAEMYFSKAVELVPAAGEFWNNWATIFVNAHNPQKAIELCEKAIELNPDALDPHWNKGLAHLELKEWTLGWEGYEWGLKDEGKRKKRQYHNEGTPEWEGPVADKRPTVVLYGEQGVGDEMLFCTMVKEATRHANIILECHPRLQRMFRRSFPGIPVYGTRKETNITWPHRHKIDAKCALGSLGKFFRNRDEDFRGHAEYLKPEAALVKKWRARLDELPHALNIGFSWKGGTKITRKDLRSIPLKLWRPLFESVEANWISLQYTDEAQYSIHEAEMESMVHHWPGMIDDLDESYCGLVPNLDLVISVNTSLVHACGVMGQECWSLTPWAPAWRYNLTGKKMIWYDSVRLIRQKKDQPWERVIEHVTKELKAFTTSTEAA